MKKLVSLLLVLTMLAGCGTTNETIDSQESNSKFDYETDYLVVGGGIAGLSSAIEASDQGIEHIMLLERTSNLGGSAFVSGGILGGYDTEISKAAGVEVDLEDLYEENMREKDYILDPELCHLTIEKSKDTINWLQETIKVPFEKEVVQLEGYGTYPAIHHIEGKSGNNMRQPYMDALSARENIEVKKEVRATELIVENDKVIGVKAQEGDKEITIKADAVLLATGGFSGNYDLFKTSAPQNRYFQTGVFPNQSGDGLLMASRIGAAYQNLDQLQVYLREYNDPRSQFPYMFTIFVGQDGKRFMDEKKTQQTYNQEIKDDVVDLYGRTGVDYFWSLADTASLTKMGIIEGLEEHPGVIKADTLEELAEKTGIDKDNLIETVNNWNKMCQTATDTEFNRTSPMWFPIMEAPYYALQTTYFSSVHHGGLVKNANAEVLRLDGSVIDGLYAAGEVTTVTNSNGYTISNAITFGRIAAQNAAKKIK